MAALFLIAPQVSISGWTFYEYYFDDNACEALRMLTNKN